nr:PREDICTED: RNA polymerase II degradation factor 1 isoform X2 [Tribolium castaneum]|eukprot:XP_015837305.1 PREDICTED: RNA polymerase II degradation factor 1 isoform X2 [Tribolium castaneum]
MSFGTEEYYKRFIELQEKLRKSEEERLKLEMKFNEMVQVTREEEQMHYRKLRAQYKRFLEEDRRRQDRNERILRSLERIESRVAMLVAKTERFKLLRQQYQNFLDRIYRTKQAKIEDVKPKEVEKPKTDDILQSYIQNLSSKKLREMLRKEEDETFDSGHPFEGDYRPNYANSIADDIMSSIYSKPSKQHPREFNNNNIWGAKMRAKSSTEDGSDIDEIPYNSGVSEAVKNFVRMGKRDSLVEQPTKIDHSLPRIEKEAEETDQNIKIEEKLNTVDLIEPQNNFESLRNKRDVSKVESTLQPEQQVQQQIDEVDSKVSTQVQPEQTKEGIEEKQQVQVAVDESGQQNVERYTDQVQHYNLEQKHVDQGQFEQQSTEQTQFIQQHVDQGEFEQQQYTDQGQFEQQHYANNSNPKTEQQYEKIEEPILPTQQYDDQAQFVQQFNKTEQPVQEQHFESEQPIPSQQFDDQGQYDENGQLIQEQQYDGEPQIPTQQYDDQGQFVQQYDTSEQQLYDQSGQQYDENGQPVQQITEQGQFVQQYDESGQHIQQYDEQYGQQYDQHGQYLQQYDETGQPIQQYDESGQPLQQYDESGQPIQQYDGTGQSIQQYDEQPVQQYDESGQPIQQYDENGQPIQQYDETGQAIQQYGENGQPIQQYDETGQPIQQYDENAQYYGDQSNVQYDENGQMIQHYDQPYDGVVEHQNEVEGDDQSVPAPSEPKKSNILELLDTDTESMKQESKVSHDSDFDFSNE